MRRRVALTGETRRVHGRGTSLVWGGGIFRAEGGGLGSILGRQTGAIDEARSFCQWHLLDFSIPLTCFVYMLSGKFLLSLAIFVKGEVDFENDCTTVRI